MIQRPADPMLRDRTRDEAAFLRRVIGRVLRTGVVTASTLMSVGMAGMLLTGRWAQFSTEAAQGSYGHLLSGLTSLRPESIAALGIVILVATPVLQLLTSAMLFARERDFAYAAVAVTVLLIVAAGALTARVGG